MNPQDHEKSLKSMRLNESRAEIHTFLDACLGERKQYFWGAAKKVCPGLYSELLDMKRELDEDSLGVQDYVLLVNQWKVKSLKLIRLTAFEMLRQGWIESWRK